MIEFFNFILDGGVYVFDYDERKLDRLKGIKPKWSDSLMSKQWIFYKAIALILVFIGLENVIATFGTLKTHET